MFTKKIGVGIVILATIFLVSSCSCTNKSQKFTKNNVSIPEGKYYYPNDGLGFSIILPEEFQYFQTQRKDIEYRVDIEFFIPTSDNSYYQEVSGYGKIMTVRVFEREMWEKDETPDDKTFDVINKTKTKVYAIKFWKSVPSDWQEKWNEDIMNEIISNFNIL